MKIEKLKNTAQMRWVGPALGVVTALLLLTMCHNSSEPVQIHRLDPYLASGEVPDDDATFNAATSLFEAFRLDYYDLFTASDFARQESVKAHVDKVNEVFSDGLGKEERILGRAFDVLKEELPDFTAPEIYSVISPYSQSIIIADTLLFVGLNHYLGADYEPYSYFPNYLAVLKERRRMPVDIVEALIRTRSSATVSPETTALDRMIYDGALTEILMRSLGVSEQEALGFSDKDMKWFEENEKPFWAELVERRLVYSTDLSVSRSLLEPSPYTIIIGQNVPGRIARLTAHRLVKGYLKAHPDVTLADLLNGKVKGDAAFLTDAVAQ